MENFDRGITIEPRKSDPVSGSLLSIVIFRRLCISITGKVITQFHSGANVRLITEVCRDEWPSRTTQYGSLFPLKSVDFKETAENKILIF